MSSRETIEIVAELDLNSTPVLRLVELLHEHSVNGVLVSAKRSLFDQVEAAIRACELEGVEVWLVDEGLESSLPDGAALATRLYIPEGFAVTTGVLVPLGLELIEDAIADTPQLLRKGYEELIDDRRFAEAIYRVALVSGVMEQVAYQDTVGESG